MRHNDKQTALDAFIARKAEIDAMLEHLKTLSGKHFGYSPPGVSRLQIPRPCRIYFSATGSQFCQTVYSCAAPRKLIADRNSCRVSNLFRKAPNIWLVTIVTPDLWTPLVVMHWCAASITTATPYGLST